MLPFQSLHYSKVDTWEGRIPWLYLDNHKDVNNLPAPLITWGQGCAISLPEASTLLQYVTVGGLQATLSDLSTAYNKVKAMKFGYVAQFYKYPNCPLLSDTGMLTLVQKRYDFFTTALLKTFANFISWPLTAQCGTLDLIWGLGPSGFLRYTHFIEDAKTENWNECAEECGENINNNAYAARNAWRKSLFLQAVQG